MEGREQLLLSRRASGPRLGPGADGQDPGRQAPRRPGRDPPPRQHFRVQFSTAERAGAGECARYLENKQDYLDYPAFLAAGWPVASGFIEGAARWLVKDRMEITGARWGLDGAEAVLKLRALAGSGDFDDYFEYHLKQAKLRNHDSLYQQPTALVQDAQALAA